MRDWEKILKKNAELISKLLNEGKWTLRMTDENRDIVRALMKGGCTEENGFIIDDMRDEQWPNIVIRRRDGDDLEFVAMVYDALLALVGCPQMLKPTTLKFQGKWATLDSDDTEWRYYGYDSEGKMTKFTSPTRDGIKTIIADNNG